MPIAPRMNNPVGPYDFWRDTLQPGLLGLYDRWTEQKPWPTPEQIDAAVQNPGLLDRDVMAGYAVDMAQPFAAKLGGLLAHGAMPPGGLFGITTWHGSPHKWTRPDISKVGTGEGAQAYGHGFYSAESPDVANIYKEGLARYDVPKEGPIQFAHNFLQFPHHAPKVRDAMISAYPNMSINEIDAAIAATKKIMDGGKKSYLYKLDIPDEDVARYLDWDKPLSEQVPDVQRLLQNRYKLPDQELIKEVQNDVNLRFADYEAARKKYGASDKRTIDAEFEWSDVQQELLDLNRKWSQTGGDFYRQFEGLDDGGFRYFGPDHTSKILLDAGIPGIRYLDGSSRSAGEGTYNYVTFDPSRIKVLERNGEDLQGLLGR